MPKKQINSSIFLPISRFVCPAVKVFKAGEELVEGRNSIVSTSSRFRDLVRDTAEKNVSSIFVSPRTLVHNVSAKKLCNTVGRKEAIRLAHFAHLLNTRSESFVTVVLAKNTLWIVVAIWVSTPHYGWTGWYISAISRTDPDWWDPRYQVLLQISQP